MPRRRLTKIWSYRVSNGASALGGRKRGLTSAGKATATGTPARLDRGGGCCSPGLARCRRGRDGKTVIADGDRRMHQALDRLKIRPLAGVAERQRGASGSGARGAADAVHIALRLIRQLVVDHMRDVGNVDAARGDIGCNENAHAAAAKRIERAHARVLRLVAVECRRR